VSPPLSLPTKHHSVLHQLRLEVIGRLSAPSVPTNIVSCDSELSRSWMCYGGTVPPSHRISQDECHHEYALSPGSWNQSGPTKFQLYTSENHLQVQPTQPGNLTIPPRSSCTTTEHTLHHDTLIAADTPRRTLHTSLSRKSNPPRRPACHASFKGSRRDKPLR
jgi:hypothetical protein